MELREKLESRRGNDAERAFRSEEQRLDIVTGVVLAQPREPLEHPPVRQHHLEPEHQLAHHPVAQHAGAAGIGREVAPDLTAPLGAQAERKEALGLIGRLLYLREDAAGFRHQRIVGRIEASDAVQPFKAQHQLRTGLIRRGSSAVAGVAAMRDHCRARRVAQGEERRDLGHRARQRHRERAALIEVTVVGEVGGALVRRGQQIV